MDFVETCLHHLLCLVLGLEKYLGMLSLISEECKAAVEFKDRIYLNITLPWSQDCLFLCILCGLMLRNQGNPQSKKLRVRVWDNGETSFGLVHAICYIRGFVESPVSPWTMMKEVV